MNFKLGLFKKCFCFDSVHEYRRLKDEKKPAYIQKGVGGIAAGPGELA